ncbi:hypothetical protein [Lysinibacter sp. HNR]|uniref:hypothetical protein n=1 Tax=Lysinibacter sp. HNR TaxID=3031408 RepID=UPI002434FDDC|nr:hypothetical protein [Lysinibacter sp. HNR]WGD36217.1 hypothetical protein FrondiHNR_06905 [Lysinibacter sp. HNR]
MMNRVFVRSVTVLAVAAVVASLTACAAGDRTTVPGCTPPFSAGSVSESISVSDGFGKNPDVQFPTPIKGTETERSVISLGTGPTAQTGDVVQIDYALYNGLTGEELESTFGEGQITPIVIPETNDDNAYGAFRCAPAGTRLVLTMLPEGLLGKQQGEQFAEAIGKNSQIIMIADVKDVIPGRSEGISQQLPNSFPTVVAAPNGRPGLIFPSGDAPEEQQTEVNIKGSGRVVTAEDTVLVKATVVNWATRAVTYSTWETNAIEPIPPAEGEDPIRDAINGQTEGSQIVMVAPSSDTSVFVIDILRAVR